jgi:hypothetical protein
MYVHPDILLPAARPRAARCRNIIHYAPNDTAAAPIRTLRPLSAIVGTVVRLHAAGHKVILVISARRSVLVYKWMELVPARPKCLRLTCCVAEKALSCRID